MGRSIEHPVPDRVKPSFVIFDIRALWSSALCQKITNGGLTRSGTGLLYTYGNSGRQRDNSYIYQIRINTTLWTPWTVRFTKKNRERSKRRPHNVILATEVQSSTTRKSAVAFTGQTHSCRPVNTVEALERKQHCSLTSGKNIWGRGWPLIIWEAITAKRDYYRTKKIETNFFGVGKICGPVPPAPNVEPPLRLTNKTKQLTRFLPTWTSTKFSEHEEFVADEVDRLAPAANRRRLKNCRMTEVWSVDGRISHWQSKYSADFDEDLDIDEVRLSSISPRSDVRLAGLFVVQDAAVHINITGQ